MASLYPYPTDVTNELNVIISEFTGGKPSEQELENAAWACVGYGMAVTRGSPANPAAMPSVFMSRAAAVTHLQSKMPLGLKAIDWIQLLPLIWEILQKIMG